MRTIEIFVFLGLVALVAYAIYRGYKEWKKSLEAVDTENAVAFLKSRIENFEVKAAKGVVEAEEKLRHYKEELTKIDTINQKID